MQRLQNKKKNFIKIGSFLVAVVICITVLATQFLSASASTRFLGVDKVIKKSSTSKVDYKILEVVPDKGLGEIGYYVKGEEDNYISALMQKEMDTGAGTLETRIASFKTIKKKLEDMKICAPDDATDDEKKEYAISGGDYQEKYFLSSDDKGEDWFSMTLSQPIVSAELRGTFSEVEDGSGEYVKTDIVDGFAPAKGAGSYNVTFGAATREEYDTGTLQYGTYELLSDGTYRKISSDYREAVAPEVYYYVTELADADGNTGNCNPIFHYEYNAAEGTYAFAQDENQELNQMEIGKLYYQTGFVNYEHLKHDVFQVADDEEDYKDFGISVVTVTMDELSKMDLNELVAINFDMLYIAADHYNENPVTFSFMAEAADTEDLSFDRMQSVLAQIFDRTGANGAASVMIDYAIFDKVKAGEEAYDSSYIYKLALACLQPNVADFYKNNFASGQTEEQTNWESMWGSIIPKSDIESIEGNYARDNVYCYYNTKKDGQNDFNHNLVSTHFTDTYSQATVDQGFSAITELIRSENQIRSIGDKISDTINQAKIIQYIIDAWNPRKIVVKTSINVLEVQPCASFELTEDMVREWASELTKKYAKDQTLEVKITTMSTAEFIGKVDDLNTEYDLVYIGANTSKMNVASGKTKYNDTHMDGLIYTHTGDQLVPNKVDANKYYTNAQLAGALDRDYVENNSSNYIIHPSYFGITTKFVFQNNVLVAQKNPKTLTDLYNNKTKEKKTVQVNDAGVLRYSGNDLTKFKMQELTDYVAGKYALVVDSKLYTGTDKTSVNAETVDNSSYLHQLLSEVKDSENVFVSSNTDHKIATDSKKLFSEYLNISKPSLDFTDNDEATTKKALDYTFTITNNSETDANTTYGINFYMDINADGQYSSKEIFNDITISYREGSKTLEAEKDATGNYKLYSGIPYTMTRNMGNGYVGYVQYKLEIHNASKSYSSIRTSKTGHKIFQGESLQQQVKILQIAQSSQETSNNLKENMNLQSQAANQNSQLYSLLHNESMSQYNITFVSVPSDKFVTKFNEAAVNGSNYIKDEEFDMIILGFADVYRDIDNSIVTGNKLGYGPLTGVLNFIKDGKSVLFTHDTTSFVNLPSNDQYKKANTRTDTTDQQLKTINSSYAYWGYNINTVLRSVVGMDRYGITNGKNTVLKAGDNLNADTNKSKITANDYAYVPRSSGKLLGAETQGYTNAILDAKNNSTYKYLKTYSADDDNRNVTRAEQVNTGQVTTYPFLIDTTLNISTTHYQYYQLDLEADDDKDDKSDIVVWYTLKGANDNYHTYNDTPRDIRNNYYIYSKGNIMYSGAGHSSFSGTSDEIKLFLNTMIAAYKNGVQSPSVTIRETESATSDEKKNEYLTFDESLEVGENASHSLDDDLTVYYEAYDSNLTTNEKIISVEYYVASDDSDAEKIYDTGLKGKKLNLDTYKASGDTKVAADGLKSGQMYRTTIPNAYTYLGEKSTEDIYVVLKSKFNYYGKNDLEKVGYGTLSLVRTNLFDLN